MPLHNVTSCENQQYRSDSVFRIFVVAGLCGAERPDIPFDGESEWPVVGEAFVD